MSPAAGIAVIVGVVGLGTALWCVWKKVPVMQCPRCFSYAVEEFTNDGAENYWRCESCDHEFKGEA